MKVCGLALRLDINLTLMDTEKVALEKESL